MTITVELSEKLSVQLRRVSEEIGSPVEELV